MFESNPENIELLQRNLHEFRVESSFDKIKSYLQFLILKNKELNLISRKLSFKEIIFDHVADSLRGIDYFKNYSSITDLGSGGGFPGIILAIVFPDKKFILIEKSPKKFKFLNEAVKILKLINTSVINSPFEELNIDTEVITCRAFKEIKEILSNTRTFLEKGGTYILYKGRREKIDEEIKFAEKIIKFNSKVIKLDKSIEKERHIVIITKI